MHNILKPFLFGGMLVAASVGLYAIAEALPINDPVSHSSSPSASSMDYEQSINIHAGHLENGLRDEDATPDEKTAVDGSTDDEITDGKDDRDSKPVDGRRD